MTIRNRKLAGAAVAAGAFAVFLCVALYRLTHASLWIDEGVEFWYSKVMTGPLPFESSANMLERINSTFQPPLYNVLMHFWLMVSTSQWWFRFFGVVAGFVGMIGLYRTARRLTENVYVSAAAVLFASFVVQLVYYWQEAAEYCLLLASVFWALYFWVDLLKAPSRRNITGLTVLSVIAVYSQYGAVFPVFIMLVTALAAVLKQKRKDLNRTLLVSWALAFVLAALPLFIFFFLPQISGQHEGGFSPGDIHFYRNNVLVDFVGGAAAVFQWCMTLHLPTAATVLCIALFCGLAALMLWKGSRFLKLMIGCNLALWIIYYAALKLNLYAYGHFRGRYALFFIPCWLVLAVAMLHEAHGLLKKRAENGKQFPARAFLCAVACLCVVYCFCSWHLQLRNNWEKEDNRKAAAVWTAENPEGKDTLVYYGATAGFSYYLYYDPTFAGASLDRVRYMPWSLRNKTAEEYAAWYDSVFGETWPREIHLVANHIGSDLKTMLVPFREKGYKVKRLNGSSNIRLTHAGK